MGSPYHTLNTGLGKYEFVIFEQLLRLYEIPFFGPAWRVAGPPNVASQRRREARRLGASWFKHALNTIHAFHQTTSY